MIRMLANLFGHSPVSDDLSQERMSAEAELMRSREEHAYSVNQRIDLNPLLAEAKKVACQTQATLDRNGWTEYLREQYAGKSK